MNDKDYIFELNEQGLDPTNPDKWDWIMVWRDILNTSDKTLTLWMREDYYCLKATVEMNNITLSMIQCLKKPLNIGLFIFEKIKNERYPPLQKRTNFMINYNKL